MVIEYMLIGFTLIGIFAVIFGLDRLMDKMIIHSYLKENPEAKAQYEEIQQMLSEFEESILNQKDEGSMET